MICWMTILKQFLMLAPGPYTLGVKHSDCLFFPLDFFPQMLQGNFSHPNNSCTFGSVEWLFHVNLNSLSLYLIYLPKIELHPLLPSEQPPFIEAWTLQGVKRVPQGCWLMLTPMLPTVVSSWLDDQCTWHLVLYPIQRHKYFVLPTHPLNGTHTQSMSQLSQGLKIV
jgi:hypothetical protein